MFVPVNPKKDGEPWQKEIAELSRDVEGRTEFNLREAIAESIRVCGREYTKEIVNAELEHG